MVQNQKSELILGLITDLFFSSRAGSRLGAAGYAHEWLEDAAAFATPADFLEYLRQRQPNLIILDLNANLPWAEWLADAKADNELAAIPWLAFGSHKDAATLTRARRAGADKVVANSAFSKDMLALVEALLAK